MDMDNMSATSDFAEKLTLPKKFESNMRLTGEHSAHRLRLIPLQVVVKVRVLFLQPQST